MNELQVFKFNENEVRTVLIDNEPYFVGKDVAEVLGYSNPRKAIQDHVDEEDKTDGVTIRDSIGRDQNPICINESGLYSLVLSSKLPQAKTFKRWVTKEVLPTIRKTGAYQLPVTPEEKINLLLQASSSTFKRMEKVEERVTNLEENRFLNPGEYNHLSNLINSRVRAVKDVHKMELNPKQNNELYRAINREIKQIAGVKCRSQLRYKDFEKVTDFVKDWEPSKATMVILGQLSMSV